MGTLSPSAEVRANMQREYRQLSLTMAFAHARHDGQVDKGGEPYIWHPMRVGMSLLPDVRAARLGFLHDVIEDTDTTFDQAALFLDEDPELLADLDALTHRKHAETYSQYLDRVEARPRAIKVKIADLRDNLDPRRQAKMALIHGAPLVASHKLKYELALSRLDDMTKCHTHNVLDFPRKISIDTRN